MNLEKFLNRLNEGELENKGYMRLKKGLKETPSWGAVKPGSPIQVWFSGSMEHSEDFYLTPVVKKEVLLWYDHERKQWSIGQPEGTDAEPVYQDSYPVTFESFEEMTGISKAAVAAKFARVKKMKIDMEKLTDEGYIEI